MIRKKLTLLVFCSCVLLLVGCGQVIELSDEQTQLIAEYAAEMLLKYDANYVDRIDEGNQIPEEITSEEIESEISEETTTEATSTSETSTQSTTEGATKQNDEPVTSETNSSEEEPDNIDSEPVVGTESNIAIIAGIDGAGITYRDYTIVDKYPATDEQGEFIYLEASAGYQLLVLQFDVVNYTDEVLPLSLIDTDLDYRIVCNGSQAAKPMLTILMDDLATLETNVEPNIQQEAVLVFQVSDGMQQQLETMDLHVTYNEVDNIIKILQ